MPDKSIVSMAMKDSINLPLDDAYIQLARNVRGGNIPEVLLPRHSTRAIVAEVLATHLSGDFTSVWLRPKASKFRTGETIGSPSSSVDFTASSDSFSNKARASAISLPVQVKNQKESVPLPKRASMGVREDIRKLAKETQYQGSPYVIMNAGVHDLYLPTVRGSLLLEPMDVDEGLYLNAQLENLNMLWDTGSHITYISDDLIAQDFKNQIFNDDYLDSYSWGVSKATMCMVDANIEFSNCTFSFSGVVVVCPRSAMPNHHSGVLLGQRSVLDRMEYTVRPKEVLLAKGVEVASDSWGQIDLHGYRDFPAAGGKFVTIE